MPRNPTNKSKYEELSDSLDESDISLGASRPAKIKKKKKEDKLDEKEKRKQNRLYNILYICSAIFFFILGIIVICLINYIKGDGFHLIKALFARFK